MNKLEKLARKILASRKLEVHKEVWTEDDLEAGDTDNRWHDDTMDMEPDSIDVEEGVSAVDKAFEEITKAGYPEPSSSSFTRGVWYSVYEEPDYRTGDRTVVSLFPKGFSLEEEKELFDRLEEYRRY